MALITNPIELAGNAQAQLSVSAVAAQTVPLAAGRYAVWCDEQDVFLKVAATADNVTTDSGFKVVSGTIFVIILPSGDLRIGAIAIGNGTLRYHRV